MIRHFLRDDDLSPSEQREVLDLAAALKADRFARRPLDGQKTAAVIFDKTSTRTQVSFSVGVADLGGNPLIMDSKNSQMGGKESISDTAKVLSRMVELIVWRTYAHAGLEEMAAAASVPVINSLSDDFHPCQILADLQTIRERRGELAGLTATYVGDAANNMGHSYLLGFATAGMHIRVAGPAGFHPREDIVADATRIAAETGGSVTILTDPVEAVRGADAVITDTWVSMGREDEKAERIATFGAYRVTPELMAHAAADAIFLHCLPAYREYEVAAEVIDGPQSVVWDEAENRVHAQKALMAWLLEESK
ncbi:ornithine carbamoyltransferase [Leucobacter triazinivorans]|uniref:Ornithine carbamoyltransferase n=1 Tax=Leucobacter triazinivorans TaxID=1784719 RepID=A0A4P6KGC5_9MICO|nr:ornithine carbamoyltransferase [Leucobacter triazinivorans]QBE49476.1 ornithine carbamoyltransferase [Leucobacter triazinivorans]